MWQSLLRSKICLRGYPFKIPWCQEAAGMLLVGSWNMGDEVLDKKGKKLPAHPEGVCVCLTGKGVGCMHGRVTF